MLTEYRKLEQLRNQPSQGRRGKVDEATIII